MYLADFTWEEVSNYLTENDSLIIPAGICEQHSKHLPLNTDTLVAEYISKYLSEETRILIAPTYNYGVGLPCDKLYSGSTSIKYEDLNNTIYSIITWWLIQGFKKFFIISAHGDPVHLKALREVSPDNTFVLELYDLVLDGILEKQKSVKHACEAETSVMLYLFPERVRNDKIEDFETTFEEFKDYLNHLREDPIADSPGCQGYPSYASKEKGNKIVELMKENALDWINKYIQY